MLQISVLLLYANRSYASGDPIVMYWAAGGVLLQLALLIFVLAGRVFSVARLAVLTAYVLYLILLWSWVWQSSQSSTFLGLALIVIPCLVIAALFWILTSAATRKDK